MPDSTKHRGIAALGARVHLFVQPAARDRFTAMFRDVLGCETDERDFGLTLPVLLVSFPDGSRFSVEFSDLAPAEPAPDDLDDATALRGAWIEFRTAELDTYQERLRAAGIPAFDTRAAHTTISALPAARSSA